MREKQTAVDLDVTPECIGSQTVGPYYSIGMNHLVADAIAGDRCPGQHVTLTGTLLDSDGVPVPDAVLEFWQPDAAGQFSTRP